jgi:hypothetical protein
MSTIAQRRSGSSEYSGYGTPRPPQIWIDQETGEHIVKSPLQTEYIYGNPELPVAKYADFIDDTIASNPVTVISSPTGSGKSTYIPPSLYESGRIPGKIYITQPRIVTARENTQWIRNGMEVASGGDMSGVIGYQTATEGDAMKGSRILQCTDGLLLQKLVQEGEVTAGDLVVVDEAHEKNINITLVIGLCHKYDIRLVIMSATHDAQKTARHAAQVRGIENVPVIEIEGRQHEIEEHVGGKFSDVISMYAQEKKNILAFVGGSRPANATIGRIQNRLPNGYTILKLNGDQTIEEQQECFKEYPEGVVVISTNVGQMGITVPNIDVVVDSGWERTGHYGDEISALKEQPISHATMIQRKGRTGRTGPGIYHLAQLEGYPPLQQDADGNFMVNQYDVPAIQRSDLSSAALRLARAGLSLHDLDLEEVPISKEIEDAHHKLVRFGAQSLNSTRLTEIGERMANIPLNPNYARMFVEAERHTETVQLQMAAMLSACQYEGITMTEKGMENWRDLTWENRSDMLVQLDVFIKSLAMDETGLHAHNIYQQRFKKAQSIYERLCRDLDLDNTDIKIPTEVERQALLACIVTGSNKLFVNQGYGKYSDQAGFDARFTLSSAIDTQPGLVVGTAFRLEHMRNSGIKGHNLVKDATIVTPEMLEKYTPWRCSYNNERREIDSTGKVVVTRDLYYDGKSTRSSTSIPAEATEETTEELLNGLFRKQKMYEGVSKQTAELYAEISRIRTYLVDFSDNGMQFEKTMGIFIDNISKWKDFKETDINLLGKVLHRRILPSLKNTVSPDSLEAKEIVSNAPQTVIYEIEGEPFEIAVRYKNNEVYIDIDPHHIRFLNEEEIQDQLNGRIFYLRPLSANKYMSLSEAIENYPGVNRVTRRATR